MKIKKVSNLNILYIAESIIFLVLCCFFTPKTDDIIFHFNEFFQFVDFKSFAHSVLYYGNGKILGNAFCVLFSKIPQIFYFVEFALVQIFCFSAEKLIEIRNSKSYFLMIFLLQPLFALKQIESWMCGFINYFIPILLLVFILIILKNDEKKQTKTNDLFDCLVIFILGISEQLFIEHNSVINLIIAITVLVVFIRKNRSALKPVILIISNVIGCIILFGYQFYIDNEQTYIYNYLGNDYSRTILTMSDMTEKIKILLTSLGTVVFFYFACIVIYTILIAIIFVMDKKDKSIKFKKINVALMLLYYPIAAIVSVLWITHRISDIRYSIIVVAMFVLNIIGFGYSFIKAVFLKLPLKYRIFTALSLFYGVSSYAPFVINSATAAFRGCWFAYIFIAFAVLIIAEFAKKEYDFNFDKYFLIFSLCACIVTASYIPAYAVQRQIYNYKAENYKTEYYLPAAEKNLVDDDSCWVYAEGNIDHEFIPYKEFKAMQK